MTALSQSAVTYASAKAKPSYAIQMLGVEKYFNCQKVLDKIDLSVEKGETLIITGESGQGKSVIMKHMLGLVKPDDGKVIVLGEDISRMSDRQLCHIRKNFGVLFQNVALFDSMTVFENIALPLRERTSYSEEKIRAHVTQKIRMMDLQGSRIEDKYPAQLSGGMQKRVGLARALILEPKIVFFDEPTTGLDARTSNDIYSLFYQTQIELGYAAVIVSHDIPKIFKLADSVALLADKVIQDVLSPEEFQRSENPLIQSFVASTMGRIYHSSEGVISL